MRLSYVDVLGDRERHEIEATVTTDHAASSYGLPVIVLADGEALDVTSWMILNYQVVEATEEELADLVRALSPYTIPTQAAALGRVGGSRTSERKATAAAANGRQGGRPKRTVVARYSDDVACVQIRDLLYLDLGPESDFSRTMGAYLTARHAGHVTNRAGHVLYYNGACDEDGYRRLYDQAMDETQ